MGGFGSGRTAECRSDLVESCRALDINRLHRKRCLTPGWQGGLQWSREGESIASIAMHMDSARLVLSYQFSDGDGDSEDITYAVSVVRVPCRFGGTRPYFLCPGVGCYRRVAKLYNASRYFLCRSCYGLSYASQREGGLERALRRARAIRARLDGDPDVEAPYPDRPKGMWNRTYERLLDNLSEADEVAEEGYALRVAGMMSSFGYT